MRDRSLLFVFERLRIQLLRLYRWIRFRHGHGVHSPFAFSFINDVVEEKSGYYAYKAIYEQIARVQLFPEYSTDAPLKYLLLLYRISNYFKPEQIIRLGTERGGSLLYLQALSSHTNCTLIESDKRKMEKVLSLIDANPRIHTFEASEGELSARFQELITRNPHTGMVVIHSSIPEETKQFALEMCLKLQNSRTVLILEGINKRRVQKCWEQLCKDERVTVSFDLIQWGIAVVDPHLLKRGYKLFF
jgi:hypothetical protein